MHTEILNIIFKINMLLSSNSKGVLNDSSKDALSTEKDIKTRSDCSDRVLLNRLT